MSGLVIGGKQVAVAGLVIRNWFDDPALRLRIGSGGDGRRRMRDPRLIAGICLHTTKGIPGGRDKRPQKILPGLGQNLGKDGATVRYWTTSDVQAGAHLVVDHDGSIVCCADLLTEATYHAGEVNEVTIGIEIYQGNDAEVYEGQLAAVVTLCDALTQLFGIQRQVQARYSGEPVPRIAAGAVDVRGIYGHRDVTTNRGFGDPGDAVFSALRNAGYESFDFSTNEDKDAWRLRQKNLVEKGFKISVDGVPGSETTAALAAAGHPHGMWVKRPAINIM